MQVILKDNPLNDFVSPAPTRRDFHPGKTKQTVQPDVFEIKTPSANNLVPTKMSPVSDALAPPLTSETSGSARNILNRINHAPEQFGAEPNRIQELPWHAFNQLSFAQKEKLGACLLAALQASPEVLETVPPPASTSLTFLTPLLKSVPEAIAFAPKTVRTNHQWMVSMMAENPDVIAYASPEQLDDETFVAPALNQNPLLIRFISKRLQDDADFLMPILRKGPGASFFISPRLRNDDTFMKPLVQLSPFAFGAASKTIRANEELAKHAVKRNGAMYSRDYLPESLWTNRSLALLATKGHGAAIQQVPPHFLRDPSFLVEAVRENFTILDYLPPSLLENEQALTVAGRENPLIFFSDAISSDMKIQIFKNNPELESEYQFFKTSTKQLGISNLRRITHAPTLKALIENRVQNIMGEGQKRAVVIFPKSDWNRTFETNSIRELHTSGNYHVRYYEVESDTEFLEAMNQATSDGPADTLLIAGHGSQSRLAFGESVPEHLPLEHEERFLDLQDLGQMDNLKTMVAQNARIILKSCGVGKGGREAKNLVNFMHQIVPHASLEGATHPMNNTLVFGDNGLIQSPGFWLAPEATLTKKAQ